MGTNKSTFNDLERAGLIKLFKLVPLSEFVRSQHMRSAYQCMRRGFIVVTEAGNVINPVPVEVFRAIDAAYGTDALQLNQTFHKSFGTVERMDPELYYTQQVLHYFSTYGHELLGLKAAPYVPVERLELPAFQFNVRAITIIHAGELETIQEAIDKYAANTVSPSKAIIEAFRPLMHRISIPTDDIKSFELQVVKHDMDGTVPSDPVSVLRYLVYKTTGETLLIKNRVLLNQIRNTGEYDAGKVAYAYDILSKADQTALASIFLRFKPIFLAYKKFPRCTTLINRLRRMADEYHRPLPLNTVQNFTTLMFANKAKECEDILEKASNRDLVKLANHLGVRLATGGKVMPGVFNVRNGRTFVKESAFNDGHDHMAMIYDWLVIITDMLSKRLGEKLKGKVFVLPEYIDYAVPVSEKQFVGNIPWGSRIIGVPDGAFTTGIHWFDQKGRVDLDLHLNSANEHYGWNASHVNGSNVIYTGDQTAAPKPNGAAEAYWFDPKIGNFVLSVNLFNGPSGCEFKMFMTDVKPSEKCLRDRNYTFDENKSLFAPIPLKFDGEERQKNLGLFADGDFYFYGGAITDAIVPRGNYPAFIKGLTAKVENQWLISELLGQAGAIVVDSLANAKDLTDEQKEQAIDLSPGSLTATTLLDIVDGIAE